MSKPKGPFFRKLWELKVFLEEQGQEEFSKVIDETFERFSTVENLRSIERIQEGILSRIRKNKNRHDIKEEIQRELIKEDRCCLHFCDEILSNADDALDKIEDAKAFVERMKNSK